MENFTFQTSTKILFGEGQIEQLPDLLAPYGKRILLTYGGGSIKKNGVYQQAMELLNQHNFQVFELGGIEPNPRLETVRKGADLCQEHQINAILAVGGGSTIDCSKVIAAAANYAGDAWDLVRDPHLIGDVLPLVTILTMAATGSEMNRNAVISNLQTNEKKGTASPKMLPRASILDPTYTFTVPNKQTAAGSADILSHLFENYFSATKDALVQDSIAEGLMRTVIAECPVALKEPDNYTARANLMWASSLALNGLIGSGKKGSWSCHPIEHELSAYYDITHGEGLAILTPRWMKYVLSDATVAKFAAFGQQVWHLPASADLYTTAEQAIQATYDFFSECGIPMTLPEVGIDDSKLGLMAEQAVKHSTLATSAYVPLQTQDVEAILQNCLTPGF